MMNASKTCPLAISLLSVFLLGACGGGGGSPGATGAAALNPSAATASSLPSAPAAGAPSSQVGLLLIRLVDAGGTQVDTLSGKTSGFLKARLVDNAGAPITGATVTFSASDATQVVFSPASGSDVTDANGAVNVTVRSATGVVSTNLTQITISAQVSINGVTTISNVLKVNVAR